MKKAHRRPPRIFLIALAIGAMGAAAFLFLVLEAIFASSSFIDFRSLSLFCSRRRNLMRSKPSFVVFEAGLGLGVVVWVGAGGDRSGMEGKVGEEIGEGVGGGVRVSGMRALPLAKSLLCFLAFLRRLEKSSSGLAGFLAGDSMGVINGGMSNSATIALT